MPKMIFVENNFCIRCDDTAKCYYIIHFDWMKSGVSSLVLNNL